MTQVNFLKLILGNTQSLPEHPLGHWMWGEGARNFSLPHLGGPRSSQRSLTLRVDMTVFFSFYCSDHWLLYLISLSYRLNILKYVQFMQLFFRSLSFSSFFWSIFDTTSVMSANVFESYPRFMRNLLSTSCRGTLLEDQNTTFF